MTARRTMGHRERSMVMKRVRHTVTPTPAPSRLPRQRAKTRRTTPGPGSNGTGDHLSVLKKWKGRVRNLHARIQEKELELREVQETIAALREEFTIAIEAGV